MMSAKLLGVLPKETSTNTSVELEHIEISDVEAGKGNPVARAKQESLLWKRSDTTG